MSIRDELALDVHRVAQIETAFYDLFDLFCSDTTCRGTPTPLIMNDTRAVITASPTEHTTSTSIAMIMVS